jgi:hypothetical protein
MTSFKEYFNYPDGDLNGQGGWSGSSLFKVDGNVVHCQKPTSGLVQIDKSIDIGDPDTIELSDLIGCYVWSWVTVRLILYSAAGVKCGIVLIGKGSVCYLYVLNGNTEVFVADVGAVAHDVLYPISFSFDTVLKKYTSIIFDGVEYGEKSAPGMAAGPSTFVKLAYNSNSYDFAYGYWDDIDIGPPTAAPTARHRFTGGIQHRALH